MPKNNRKRRITNSKEITKRLISFSLIKKRAVMKKISLVKKSIDTGSFMMKMRLIRPISIKKGISLDKLLKRKLTKKTRIRKI